MTREPEQELLVVAEYGLSRDDFDEVWTLVEELAASSREETGNLHYEPLRGGDDRIVILEWYRSPADFEMHRNSPHFRRIALDRIVPKLITRTVGIYRAT